MKKIIFLLLSLMIIVTLSINARAVNDYNTNSYLKSSINGVTLISNNNINIKEIKKHGFNTVFLNVDNIRNSKQPYNTNFKALKLLYNNISQLDKANLAYVIGFSSGPGYSSDGKVTSIFKNSLEMKYFSQMVMEIIGRYKTHSKFLGASINLSSPDIEPGKYYYVQNYIIDKVRSKYKALTFVYNLHPLSFEEGYKNLPKITKTNIIMNLNINLKGLSYPGNGVGYKTSCELNKNALLANLTKLKENQNVNSTKTIITLKTPWVKNSEVLLQDSFEIFQMLKFNYSLSYGNSSDLFDFNSNSAVLKTLDRHNK